MKRRIKGLVVIALAATTIAAAAPNRPGPFSVAVLRQDGGLIPVGAYTGRRWESPWPNDALTELEIPLTLAAIPRAWWGKPGPRPEWHVWAGGQPAGTVRVTRPAVLAVQCQSRIALLTDYRSPAPAPAQNVQPYPKAGLAVSPNVPFERIDVLSVADPDWTTILPTLKDAFDLSEDSLAASWMRAGDPHPVPQKERHAATPVVEAMYESGDLAHRVYYVEASRTYDHSADERAMCAVAFGGAYFERDGAGLRSLGVDIRVVPCDRRGVLYMLPFGAMRIDSRTYWLAQLSSWDREEYDVIEFRRPHVEAVAATRGGGC